MSAVPLNRYLVFAGAVFYAKGGWSDFIGDTETIEEAVVLTEKKDSWGDAEYEWAQIVDTRTGLVVKERAGGYGSNSYWKED